MDLSFMDKIIKQVRLAWEKGFYPQPKPLPRERSYWIGLGLVSLAVLVYIVYFTIYLTAKQDAFKTNAEDLGIMDQVMWSLLHGYMFHQTICNILSDTNCYGLNGVSRFAIHFEPILLPISLLYVFWPDPKTLMIFQAIVVASGAFPAFWLARLRLRNVWAAVPFAVLYLLYPAQQYAVNFDFHPETLTIALLLFAIYFLYTRNNVWCLIFVFLSLACKEEIAGVVAMLGLWALVLQRRWFFGFLLVGMALAGAGIAVLVVHLSSPVGHSLLTSRYSYLGKSVPQVAITILTHPVTIIQQHLLDPAHRHYLRDLLAPAGYLPLLAPWVLIMAAPTLALNMLSTDPNMYSGRFQYNAEIVPILIFATIEALVLIAWAVRMVFANMELTIGNEGQPLGIMGVAGPLLARMRTLSPDVFMRTGALALVVFYLLIRLWVTTHTYNVYSVMPYTNGFIWPQVTAHDTLAAHFIDEIPPNASVTTQTALGAHLSERQSIYLYPYAINSAEYILLDTTGKVYPFVDYASYATQVTSLLQSGRYGIVDMDDGYILLKLGSPPGDTTLALQWLAQDGPKK
jgi:uncharacterized membrane protein